MTWLFFFSTLALVYVAEYFRESAVYWEEQANYWHNEYCLLGEPKDLPFECQSWEEAGVYRN